MGKTSPVRGLDMEPSKPPLDTTLFRRERHHPTMTASNPVQCPICGWTGQPADLDSTGGESACPTCGESME